MSSQLISADIPPLVRRHAEDAAFYWAQHDGSAHSPRLLLSGLERFSHLLSANLEGLEVAAGAAWEPAVAALERWKKPSEAFVAAYIAYAGSCEQRIERCWQLVESRPDQLLRGVISALAWLPAPAASEAIATLSHAGAPAPRQVASLRALTLLGAGAPARLNEPLTHYLGSIDHHVRAAGWRLAAVRGLNDMPYEVLRSGLDDPSYAVRAEAAVALGRSCATILQDRELAALANSTLVQCVMEQAAIVDAAGGWDRMQALRRLSRYLLRLAVMLPVGDPAAPQLLKRLPVRAALSFVAAHGDPRLLPFAVEHMSNDQAARYAGWAWETVTGVDIITAGLALPEPASGDRGIAVDQALLDADQGLPLPDGRAIAHYPLAHLEAQGRFLRGSPITLANALRIVDTGPQAQRAIALGYLTLMTPQLHLTNRMAASQQKRLLADLHMKHDGKDDQ